MVLCGILTLVLVPALLPRSTSRDGPRGADDAATRGVGRPAAPGRSRARLLVDGRARASPQRGCASIRRSIDCGPCTRRGTPRRSELAPMFGLPGDVYVVLAGATNWSRCSDQRAAARRISSEPARAPRAGADALLPSQADAGSTAGAHSRRRAFAARVRRVARRGGRSGQDSRQARSIRSRSGSRAARARRLTYEGYVAHGLADLIGRFVVRDGDRWLLATYVFPSRPDEIEALERWCASVDPSQTLTGLPLVNRELADRFLPQFVKGLSIGTMIVVALVFMAFRNWRLSLFALAPTAVGIVWAAGVLALARRRPRSVRAVRRRDVRRHRRGLRRPRRAPLPRAGRSRQAVEELAPVILVAAAITLLGYGTLVTRPYPPLRSIGLVSAVSIVTLAGASLFVLPALLRRWARRETDDPRVAVIPAFNEAADHSRT